MRTESSLSPTIPATQCLQSPIQLPLPSVRENPHSFGGDTFMPPQARTTDIYPHLQKYPGRDMPFHMPQGGYEHYRDAQAPRPQRPHGLGLSTAQSGISSKKSRPKSSAEQAASPDEDWTKISDLAERRRIQNRIAQRNYRKKLKKRLEDLEKRVGEQDDSESMSASPELVKSPIAPRQHISELPTNFSYGHGQAPPNQPMFAYGSQHPELDDEQLLPQPQYHASFPSFDARQSELYPSREQPYTHSEMNEHSYLGSPLEPQFDLSHIDPEIIDDGRHDIGNRPSDDKGLRNGQA